MANNSQTGSSSFDPLGRSRSEIGLEVALSILICLISILDNLLVVYVVNNDSRLKSVTSIFIHNLALTDIFMASLQRPFWIISLYKGTWIFRGKWCEISASILFTCGLASILTMGLIAVNRYIRVVKPALYNRFFPSKRIARVYCVLVWVASMLLVNSAILWVWQDGAQSSFCYLLFRLESRAYFIYHTCSGCSDQRNHNCNILLLLQDL